MRNFVGMQEMPEKWGLYAVASREESAKRPRAAHIASKDFRAADTARGGAFALQKNFYIEDPKMAHEAAQ